MSTQARHLPDWEVDLVPYPWTKRVALFAGLVGPIVGLGIVVSLLGGTPIGALLIMTAFSVCLLVSMWWRTERLLLRTSSMEPLDDPRFANIVEGLAGQYKMTKPRLYVSEEGGPNALVFRKRGPAIVVRRSLLDTYTRTELEAVAAHCLVRMHSGHLSLAYLAAFLGRTGSRFAPKVGYEDDVHTVALTRYPPALESAIRKAKPVEGPSGVLWFVAHGPSHRPLTERVAALQDL